MKIKNIEISLTTPHSKYYITMYLTDRNCHSSFRFLSLSHTHTFALLSDSLWHHLDSPHSSNINIYAAAAHRTIAKYHTSHVSAFLANGSPSTHINCAKLFIHSNWISIHKISMPDKFA